MTDTSTPPKSDEAIAKSVEGMAAGQAARKKRAEGSGGETQVGVDRPSRPARGRGGEGRRRERSEEKKEFDEELLQIDRVSRMMKGGRRMSFRASVVIGDRKGRVGFGMAKASEVQAAVAKAVRQAKKALVTLPLQGDAKTIPYDLKLKFKAAEVWLAPASVGTGVLAGNAIRPIVELAGLKNIRSKNYGTRNKVVVAQATIKALSQFVTKKATR